MSIKKIIGLVLALCLLPVVASAQMSVTQGGTGRSSFTGGDFIYANSDAFQRLTGTTSPFFLNFSFRNATGTNATTTNFFSTTASSTNLYGSLINGFGLSTCNTAGSSAVTWAAGKFGCNTISGGGGSSSVATSSQETATYIPFWTSTNGTPALLSGGNSGFTFNNSLSKLSVTNYQATTGTTTSATSTSSFSTTASSTNLFSSLAAIGGNALNVIASGNVGIGTTNPANQLSILPSASGKGLTLRESDDGNDAFTANGFTSGATLNGFTNGTQTFLVDTTTGGKMYFNNGNVGFGTTNPAAKLDVLGTASSTTFSASNGSASAPSYTFSSFATDGFFSPSGGAVDLTTSGVGKIRLSTDVQLTSSGLYKWGSGTYNSSVDLYLGRQAAGVLALNNDSTHGVTLNVATDSTLKIFARDGSSAATINIQSTIIGNTVTAGLSLIANNGGSFGFGSRGIVRAPSDGVWTLLNNAETDFNRLQFGGTTSSFPAIKRSGTTLAVRLADDTDNADFSVRAMSMSSTLTMPATGSIFWGSGASNGDWVQIADGVARFRTAAGAGFALSAVTDGALTIRNKTNGANGNLIFANSTSTNATTTSLAISSIQTSLLKTDANGSVIPAILGTDYINSTDQNYKEAVKYVTTTALPTVTYANGSSGVGATLTGVALAAISIDSASPSVGDRLLVKNQVAQEQNGIYTVTATGSGIAVFVLTRATDFDQAADIMTGDTIFVTAGTTQSATTWAYTGIDSPTMGTTAITFVQVAGQGSFTAGNGISISGTTISQDFTFGGTYSGANIFNNITRSTTTAATTTSLFATTASSTNLFSSLAAIGGSAFNVISSGNVGIGTTNPTDKLHVIGNVTIAGNATSTNFFSTTASSTNLQTSFLGVASSSPVSTLGVGAGAITVKENKLATSTSMTIDWTAGNQQLVQKGTAGITLSFSNVNPGARLSLIACNPGSAGGSFTFPTSPTILWPGGTAPTQTTTANKCDLYTFAATYATSTATTLIFGGFNQNY